VHIAASGEVTYVARDGDTVSQLAVALLGSDSKEHRDAIIAANPTLQSNPDLVLAGQTYSLALPLVPSKDDARTDHKPTATAAIPTTVAKPEKDAPSAKPATDAQTAAVEVGPKLEYSAQRGDTVRVLAANLLGGDTKANRDAIIAGNTSLQQDPDHLVAGQSYTIPAPNGLTADPNEPQAKLPTTRPDADDVLRQGASRTLRYTAQSGDSVSKLAIVLMGTDTQANRDLIIKNNPSLKKNPDHLTAGETYWIEAPTADAKP
jgi:phage tail protein X